MVEDHLLDPAVETFLLELIDRGEISDKEVERELGIDRKDVKSFADLLEREGIIQRNYTEENGEMYRYDEENHDRMFGIYSSIDTPENELEKTGLRKRELLEKKLNSYLSTYRKRVGAEAVKKNISEKVTGKFLH